MREATGEREVSRSRVATPSSTSYGGLALIKAVGIASGAFLLLGTMTALWENPFFIRMTPAGPAEIALLGGQSVLLGLYFTIPRGSCATGQAGVGSLFAFLGVACPVCNKILLFAFGSELLLVYFEPVRVYVAVAGFLLTGLAVWLKWTRGGLLSTQPFRP